MRPSIRKSYGWQRQFMPQVKRILGEQLIAEAPFEEDAERNTDLIVLRLEAVRIACRLREHRYLARYHNEFTIRATRPSGVDTELAKVISGWGQYIFYGFVGPSGHTVAAWLLGDLNVFRLWHGRYLASRQRAPGQEQPNGDGSSTFRSYRIADLPDEFVVARQMAPEHVRRAG